jgi:toxin ParE1/3/4
VKVRRSALAHGECVDDLFQNRDFRQLGLAPYRIIYRVIAQEVFVLLIADGRRDMQGLLERRLLGR